MPILFEAVAQRAVRRLPPEDREALIDRLYDIAEADEPTALLDPYTPGGMGPIPYHGVVVAAGALAVVSLYVGEIRVLSVSPNR